MQNSLLNLDNLPHFSKVLPEEIEPTLDQILQRNRETVKELLQQESYSWDNVIQPLEDMELTLAKMWSVVTHLNNVVNNEALREVYNRCLPKLTDYAIEMEHNVELYDAFRKISESSQFQELNQSQKRIIKNALRDFKLSGVTLPESEKKKFSDVQKQLVQLTNKFEENVLDATDGWSKLIRERELLKGIPENTIKTAKKTAKEKNLEGWLLTLEYPCYYAVITFADNRELRKEFYKAYSTRASDQATDAAQWDNSKNIDEILALRHQEAKLVGFNNYAEYSLATKMAKDTNNVMQFLQALVERSKPVAEKEWKTLQDFARDKFKLDPVEVWDILYLSEKLRQKSYALSQEELRAYFPIDHVLSGMFTVAEKLYGIKIIEKMFDFDPWHEDVRLFEIYDQEGKLLAGFYIDLYARPHKRGGAWMDSCRDRHRDAQGKLQLPIAFLICNFASATNDTPSLLTHEEVLTLFHEFGHSLHHTLTKIDCASVAGCNGVAWDAVELPSQFMENWCWEKEVIDLISCHYETKQPLPDALFEKLLATKNFQSGMQLVRQLELSIFDFRIHLEYTEKKEGYVQQILDEVRHDVAVVPVPEFNRFQHAFTHIFGGEYAAGYYSYKWAEVLSCDAFTQFQENGIFDQETGRHFLHTILEQGGSRKPLELFVEFQGREPKIDALLKHSGLEG